MAEPFQYHFSERLLDKADLANNETPPDIFLDDVISRLEATVSAIEQFRALPERNQTLILDMARGMIRSTNDKVETFEAGAREHFWGLYLIGSRARGEATPESDLDLLSVGSFGHDLSFLDPYRRAENRAEYTPFKDFERVSLPLVDELPDEYNIGETERKYWVLAVGQQNRTADELLDTDLAVVDLTDVKGDLETFEAEIDLEDDEPLARIPLVKLSVAERPMIWTM